MTTAVSDSGSRVLDFTGDSIQLTSRKGADLLWVHRFSDSDGNPLDISTWIFDRDVGGTRVSSGGVRNGVDATGQPESAVIDIVPISTGRDDAMGTAITFNDAIQCYFPTSLLTNVNPSSGRSNQASFEIEAEIPTGRMNSAGNPINVIQVIAAGQLNLFSDVYTATAP